MLILSVADFLSTSWLFVFASQMFPASQQLPFCICTLKLQRVELSWPPHIKDLWLFGEHMLCGWEQFANSGVINKTNKLCKDTDINHGAAGGKKEHVWLPVWVSIWPSDDRATTERLSVGAEYTSEPVWSRVSGRVSGWLSAHSCSFMSGSAEIHPSSYRLTSPTLFTRSPRTDCLPCQPRHTSLKASGSVAVRNNNRRLAKAQI